MEDDPESVLWLREVLADVVRDSMTRVAALNTLTRKEGAAAYPRLIAALEDADTAVVEAAEVLLVEIGPPVVPTLGAAMFRTETARPEKLARVLGRIGTPSAVEPLCHALAAPSRVLRKHAAQVLGELRPREAVEPLCQALKDEPGVSKTAANALAEIGDRRAVEPLCRALQDYEIIAAAAADALGRLGDPAAVSALGELLATSWSPLQRAACEALGRIRSPDAAPFLCRVLTDDIADVQRAAAEVIHTLGATAMSQGLAERDNADLLEPLAHALCSAPYPRARAAAAIGLGACRRREAHATLRARLRPLIGERDSSVLPFIRTALEQIERETDVLASRPIPSQAPPSDPNNLPLPADDVRFQRETLPLASQPKPSGDP